MYRELLFVVGLMLFICSLVCLVVQSSRALMVLFLLEALTVSNFLVLLQKMMLVGYCPSSIIVFLVLSVCEASLGLALLVFLIRAQGSDLVSSF